MTWILAATHHDPEGRLLAQMERVLPLLAERFAAVAVLLTPTTVPAADALLHQQGAVVRRGLATWSISHLYLGVWRRAALAAALGHWPMAPHFLFCDLDRMLHWAACYPDELVDAMAFAEAYACTIYGRTARAFASHPRAQRETEALVHHSFALASGHQWDVMAAARGFSRPAAELIVTRSQDPSVGSDCSWPLLCQRAGLSVGYMATEGMEFETPDRYAAEIAQLGGVEAWLAQLDSDPQHWLLRLEIARAELRSALSS
ncbi:hypothetical protein [Candidatus Viridilinea mediisalina]|uniref:DUF5672 domain-containing protein n=1 Tax=Candidatus Viridilinea mediisalina TaxID=2024553 RepID=A0A2A6RF41_9CHLR|nr:hypothetical protein [Candidatus Viridilinea mediisalina]PDW01697.1 hypothetical protein CJ255_17725 [Candidatus Viridilinea mediisalina]